MDKRFQVFVSSTYTDLKDERQAVMSALLQLSAIPAGMELFPVADDDAWTLIQRVIDDCDYYLLLIGGKYGSVDADGLSFTEKEFDYAASRAKPIMAFLHSAPDEIPMGKSEKQESAQQALMAFRSKVESRKHVKFWSSAEDLAGKVALSFAQFTQTYSAVGWIRADQAATSDVLDELNTLRKENADISQRLQAAQETPPESASGLAGGKEKVELVLFFSVSAETEADTYGTSYSWEFGAKTTWDELLYIAGPKLLDECAETILRKHLAQTLLAIHEEEIEAAFAKNLKARKVVKTLKEVSNVRLSKPDLSDQEFGIILVQFKALGLITKSARPRSVKDRLTYWALTPYGESHVTSLMAIKSPTPDA